jgi:hypothetical protein
VAGFCQNCMITPYGYSEPTIKIIYVQKFRFTYSTRHTWLLVYI